MKEHPIIFSTQMVQVILQNKKTQTRRVIKPQPTYPYWCGIGHGWDDGHGYEIKCPYEPGDILWVRETWQYKKYGDYGYTADDFMYKADTGETWVRPWKPSIYMPRKAARMLLKVTNIRVERLQDITEKEAKAEGCSGVLCDCNHEVYACENCYNTGYVVTPKQEFIYLWNDMYVKRGYGWDTNPYVWVIEFEKIKT